MNDERINELLNGRLMVYITGAVVAVSAFVAAHSGTLPLSDAGSGMFFNIKGTFIDNPTLSVLVNVVCVLAIGALLLLLDKTHTVVRGYTFITATMFFVLETACPLLTRSFNTGTAMCLTLIVGTIFLFSAYQNKRSQRTVFLVMAVLSLCVMFHWAFITLVPTFLLGFAYMRAMNFKGWLAAIIGLVTPFWIAMGLGLINLNDFHFIEAQPLWNTLETAQVGVLIAWLALLLVVAVVTTVTNMLTIYHYRLQLRVYNAFFMLVLLSTLIAMCIDYRNLYIFIPLLNLYLAVQLAHAFTISTLPKRHIVVLVLMGLALLSYVSTLML